MMRRRSNSFWKISAKLLASSCWSNAGFATKAEFVLEQLPSFICKAGRPAARIATPG
jgi:hypothetical protein